MTELYIDGQRVTLPKKFNITLIEENPFFTKNGKYTYDINLSLLDANNARIYKHINRINSADIPQDNRRAILIVDNEVVINGTESILDVSNTSVKIQLLSGNSELNFLVGGDRMLRDLDLGKAVIEYSPIEPSNPDSILTSHKFLLDNINKPYPENNWLVLPYYDRDNDLIGNRYYIDQGSIDGLNGLAYTFEFPFTLYSEGYTGTYRNHRPQPYLCFIINKVLETIGYTLSYNYLQQHSMFKYLYIVHGYDTLEFAKMLPGWTVNEFFTELEKLFDCTVLIDEKTRNVQFIQNYLQNENIPDEDVIQLDEFNYEIDKENLLTNRVANIGYDLTSDSYYLYQNLNADVHEKATPTTVENLNELLDALADTNDTVLSIGSKDILVDMRDRRLWYVVNHDTYYIGRKNDNGTYYPQKVDAFRPLLNNPDVTDTMDIEFKIIPAAMAVVNVPKIFDELEDILIQVPVPDVCDPLYNDKDFVDEYSLEGIIEGEIEFESNVIGDRITLAFYSGLRNYLGNIGGSLIALNYPVSYVDNFSETYGYDTDPYFYYPSVEYSRNPGLLRLDQLNLFNYSKRSVINTTKIYKLQFINKRLNVRAEFISNNKRYLCSKIERIITSDGFGKLIKGEFYPIE